MIITASQDLAIAQKLLEEANALLYAVIFDWENIDLRQLAVEKMKVANEALSNAIDYNIRHLATRGFRMTNYSAKKASQGKDIGKPGKNFAKIASSAGKKYGSAAAGKKVAGAILAKLRAKGK